MAFAGTTHPSLAFAAGHADQLSTQLDLGFQAGLLEDLHAVVIAQRSQITFEKYFAGPDESWGQPLGNVQFSPDTLHDLRSVTKSITSLLYGIALAEGKVPAPDTPLLNAFPQYADLAKDPRRAAWTVAKPLNMSMGTEWNEQLPYTDPRNSEIMMENAEDRYRFILDRPIIEEPGQRWHYNGGCTALIGYLIAQGTGKSIDTYAKEKLFDPLGISECVWMRGKDNVPSPASGLRLSPYALTRIGQLVLAEGNWDDTQIIPKQWLESCTVPHGHTPFGAQYSQFWYLTQNYVPAKQRPVQVMSANGNGGQRLFILPDLDLTVTVLCGSYNRPDQWITPMLVLDRLILPSLP